MRIFRPRWIVAALALSIFLVVGLFSFSNKTEVMAILQNLPLDQVIFLIVLSAALLAVRTYRWKLLLEATGVKLSYGEIFSPFSISLAASLVTPGKVGDVVRCFLLKTDPKKSMSSVFIERMLDMILLFIFALIFLSSATGISALPLMILGLILLAAVVTFMSRRLAKFIYYLMIGVVNRIHKEPRKVELFLKSFYHQTRMAVMSPAFYLSIILTIFIWSVEFYRIQLGANLVGITLGWFSIGTVFSFAILVGVVSMIPGGLGGFDAAITFILLKLGKSLAAITSLLIIERIVAYWFIVVLGLLQFFLMTTKKNKTLI